MGSQESFNIGDLWNIAGLAYSNGHPDPQEPYIVPKGYSLIDQSSDVISGYNGAAFYNAEINTLAIGSGGTNPANPLDILQDYGVMVSGATAQALAADRLTISALEKLRAQGITDPNIVYTGHSLGGLDSQIEVIAHPGAKAVVFNSPGVYGFWGDTLGLPGGGVGLPDGAVTYVYSEKWGPAALIHGLGVRLPGEVIYVPETFGHGLAQLGQGLNASNSLDTAVSTGWTHHDPGGPGGGSGSGGGSGGSHSASGGGVNPSTGQVDAPQGSGGSGSEANHSLPSPTGYSDRGVYDVEGPEAGAAGAPGGGSTGGTSYDDAHNSGTSGHGNIMPIILDLDGDGVEVNASARVSFDWDGDGFQESGNGAACNLNAKPGLLRVAS